MKRSFVFALFLLFAGCDSSTDRDPDVSGSWSGVVVSGSSSLSVVMNLTESNGTVSGSGSMAGDEFIVIGTHHYPEVSLVLVAAGFNDAGYEGVLRDDGRQITGTWTWPNYGEASLILSK